MSLNTRVRKTSKTIASDPTESVPHLTQQHFEPEQLPDRKFPNPMRAQSRESESFLSDAERYIMYDPHVLRMDLSGRHAMSLSPFRMRVAQVAEHLHFNPAETVVGIVTCGGLCPGLNDVVRGITYMCRRTYGVKRVIGFRYGYWGLSAAGRDSAIDLDTAKVSQIHMTGGTFLGSSRGPQKESEMVDTLVEYGINILFTIGGDGTQRGAQKIASEARKRGLDIAVVGIPKTIDNDLSFSHRTFGYQTAVEHATSAIRAAYSEASSHPYGVGIVKVMGRHSGFIAAQATIASQMANLCLVPEQPITQETFFKLLDTRFCRADYVVICVAEGFGQDWLKSDGSGGTDASGNKKLDDIGTYMRDLVAGYLKRHPKANKGTVKLIDPSYMIRAVPPNTSDASFCVNLATLAVHEGMKGTTNAIISCWYNNFIVVPISLATSLRKVVDVRGELWRQVREMTVHVQDSEQPSDRERCERLARHIQTLESDVSRAKLQLAKLRAKM